MKHALVTAVAAATGTAVVLWVVGVRIMSSTYTYDEATLAEEKQ